MGTYGRYKVWDDGTLADSMSFSSFSHSVDDIWAHNMRRPYKIVLLPGYSVPASLDKGDQDAMWLQSGTIEAPLVVWDGFCPTALHEIILECFDYEGESPFIKVVHGDTGMVSPDRRNPDLMRIRPRRTAGLGPRGIRKHLTELLIWSYMFPGDDKTSRIYGGLLSPSHSTLTGTLDSFKRAEAFRDMGMSSKNPFSVREHLLEQHDRGAIRINVSACLGDMPPADPDRLARDAEVAQLDLSGSVLGELARLELSDFPPGKRPKSFYLQAVKKHARIVAESRARSRQHMADIPKADVDEPRSSSTGADDNPF